MKFKSNNISNNMPINDIDFESFDDEEFYGEFVSVPKDHDFSFNNEFENHEELDFNAEIKQPLDHPYDEYA